MFIKISAIRRCIHDDNCYQHTNDFSIYTLVVCVYNTQFIVSIITFTETFANGHYLFIDFSMEYQGSNPNVDYYPEQKRRNKISVSRRKSVRSFCSFKSKVYGWGEPEVSTQCGNRVHPNAATDMHGTVLDARWLFCGLYIVEYYVGIAGNCTP